MLVVGMLGFVFHGGGFFLFAAYRTQKAWSDACAEADGLDPGWRWQDLIAARPNPPDDANIAVRAQAVRAATPANWPDWANLLSDADVPLDFTAPAAEPPPMPPGLDGPFSETADDRRRWFGNSIEQDVSDSPAVRLSAGQIAALRKAVAAAWPALDLAHGLGGLLPGRIPPNPARPLLRTLFRPWLQDLRTVAVMLRLESALLVEDGRPEAALDNCRVMLDLQKSAMTEPMLINALVAISIRAIAVSQVERVLGQTEPDSGALETTRRAFESALAEPVMLEALRGERAFVEDCVRSVDEGLLTPAEVGDHPPPPNRTGVAWIDRLLHRLGGGRWTKRHSAAVLRYHTTLVGYARESPDGLRTHANEVATHRAEMGTRVGRAAQSCHSVIEGDRRSRALLTATATALAAERFRREHGRWPGSIDELLAVEMLAALPADPFDGRPLRTRRLADGLVIYSVGQNLTDDGGQVRPERNNPGLPKDYGIRMWDAIHRRQVSR